MHWTVITWLLTAISVAGTFFVIRKKTVGFGFWVVSNIGWVYIDIKAGLTAQAVLFVVYLALSVYGIWEWKREAILKSGFVSRPYSWLFFRTRKRR